MSHERVAIVIPCFNSGKTIHNAIDSARQQSWPSLEIIVVDDGSTDLCTLNILNTLEGITLVRQEHKGLAAARNAGFRSARSKYILLLDSDDWLERNAVEALMACLISNNASCYVYPYIKLEGESSGVLCKSFNFFEQLFLNQIPYCLLLPYSLWLRAGGYDETMSSGYEDWEFNIRLASLGYLGCVVPMPLLHYRVSSSGMLISYSSRHHGLLWKYIQRKHQALYTYSNLLLSWSKWRLLPSTYPLCLYFVWLALYRLLPTPLFSTLFRLLRTCSHSSRITFLSRF